jgi:hypothetical protein
VLAIPGWTSPIQFRLGIVLEHLGLRWTSRRLDVQLILYGRQTNKQTKKKIKKYK